MHLNRTLLMVETGHLKIASSSRKYEVIAVMIICTTLAAQVLALCLQTEARSLTILQQQLISRAQW